MGVAHFVPAAPSLIFVYVDGELHIWPTARLTMSQRILSDAIFSDGPEQSVTALIPRPVVVLFFRNFYVFFLTFGFCFFF